MPPLVSSMMLFTWAQYRVAGNGRVNAAMAWERLDLLALVSLGNSHHGVLGRSAYSVNHPWGPAIIPAKGKCNTQREMHASLPPETRRGRGGGVMALDPSKILLSCQWALLLD